MKDYHVIVSYKSFGDITVQASSEEEAKKLATEAAQNGKVSINDEEIEMEWHSVEMLSDDDIIIEQVELA